MLLRAFSLTPRGGRQPCLLSVVMLFVDLIQNAETLPK